MMNKALLEFKNDALQDEYVAKFVSDNKLSEDEIEEAVFDFYNVSQALKVCKACKGKGECRLETFDTHPGLVYANGVKVVDLPCEYKDLISPRYLELLYFPGEYVDGDLKVASARSEVYKALKAYNKNPLKNQGIYLHGTFGTGKTFILLKEAKELAKKRINVVFVYYPDFCRAIKMNITTGNNEAIINKCKQADVLMFDDIGGEGNSSFVRDEVLGPILQYRMFAYKPTFMSSNYSINELEQHLAEAKDSSNLVNASRVVERIKMLMTEIELDDVNYRK